MTTEDEFQAMLDANPEDWQTRLVFADWLQERGDPRAEGYRALGALRRRASGSGKDGRTWFSSSHFFTGSPGTITRDWFVLLDGGACLYNGEPSPEDVELWRDYPTRREAEDAAAFAFAELSETRRKELLTTQPV